MFLEERYDSIVKTIKENGRVTVKNLAKQFEVSEDCIRKDLKELENRNELKRVYGGAVLKRNHNEIKSINERQSINLEKKKKIASKALGLIKEGDVIFLDASTVNLELARAIVTLDIRLTIVTNMIQIIVELNRSTNIKAILIGGEFDFKVGAIMGTTANTFINKFSYDKAFIGTCAVNRDSGVISSNNLEDGDTKKAIIDNSIEKYIVTESDKFNYDEFYKFTRIDEVSAIITEDEIIYGENFI